MKIVLAVLQFLLFLAIFFVGSFLPALGLLPNKVIAIGDHRFFTYDGILMAFLVYLFILAIEALRKRLRDSGTRTTVAFVLAVALGLFMKFGLKTL